METILPQDQRPLSYKDWALNIFLSSLPIIGIILLFVWAFSDAGNIHRKAWAKGQLLLFVIAIIFVLVFLIFFGGLAYLGAAFNN